MKKTNTYIEIGIGHAEFINELALNGNKFFQIENTSENKFIGYEIKGRYFKMAKGKLKNIKNVELRKTDGFVDIENYENNSISGIFVLFPDPLYKSAEEKSKRIDSTWFNLCAEKLVKGGFIFFATDWMEYYDYLMDEIYKISDLFKVKTDLYLPEDFVIPKTHYYKKWVRLDRDFKYISLIK